MSFTIDAKLLGEAITLPASVSDRKQVLPITGALLMVAKDGTLAVTANNLEQAVTTRVQVDGELEVCLDAKKLAAIVKGASGPVKFDNDGQNVLVRNRRSRYKLAGFNRADFPYPDALSGQELEIPAASLFDLISSIAHAQAKNDVRYFLNGALFEFGSELTLAATDGHRLAVNSAAVSSDKQELIVPRDGIAAIQRLLSSDGGTAKLQAGRNALLVSAGKSVLHTKAIDGKFPDFRRVMPDQRGMRVVDLDREAALEAVRQVMVVAGDSEHAPIKVEGQDGAIKLSHERTDAAEATIATTGDVSALSTGLNARYLKDALESMPGDTIQFLFRPNHPFDSMMFKQGAHGVCNVIMPIRI